MSILTNSGRVAIAELIKNSPLHMAWGPGNTAWTTPPAESPDATAVAGELGRRTVTDVQFVVPDTLGPIEIPGAGKFSTTTTPTKRLVVSCQFAFDDAPTATIRQIGLFTGTVLVPGLPAGLRYFTPDQIQSPGRLLQIQNREAVPRSPEARNLYTLLLEF